MTGSRPGGNTLGDKAEAAGWALGAMAVVKGIDYFSPDQVEARRRTEEARQLVEERQREEAIQRIRAAPTEAEAVVEAIDVWDSSGYPVRKIPMVDPLRIQPRMNANPTQSIPTLLLAQNISPQVSS